MSLRKYSKCCCILIPSVPHVHTCYLPTVYISLIRLVHSLSSRRRQCIFLPFFQWSCSVHEERYRVDSMGLCVSSQQTWRYQPASLCSISDELSRSRQHDDKGIHTFFLPPPPKTSFRWLIKIILFKRRRHFREYPRASCTTKDRKDFSSQIGSSSIICWAPMLLESLCIKYSYCTNRLFK